MYVFLIFLNAAIWSSSFAISKLAMEAASPLFVTGSRMLVAGGILVLVARIQNIPLRVSKRVWAPILIFSFFGCYLTNVCEFLGMQGLSSAKACFIYGLSPFISALFSYFQLKETVTFKKVLGLCLGMLGYVVFLLGGNEAGEMSWSWSIGKPEILLLLATLFASYGWTLLRKIEKNFSLPVVTINVYAMIFSGIASVIHSGFTEPWAPLPVQKPALFIGSILLLVLLSNLICYNLYAKLLQKFSSTFLSFCNLVMPLFSAFYGWLLLKEAFPMAILPAVLCMFVGCRLIYHEEFRQGYVLS